MTINRGQIIVAAQEAGIVFDKWGWAVGYIPIEKLDAFYAIALEHGRSLEREECAKVCDRYKNKSDIQPEDCAFAIRARSTK